MRLQKTLVFLAFAIGTTSLYSQAGEFTLGFAPTLSIPIGPVVDGDLPLFGVGGGGSLRGELVPGFARYLNGRAALGFEYLPYNGAKGGLSVLSAGGNIGFILNPSPRLSFRLGGGGGIYMAMSDLGTVRNPYFEGGAEMAFRLGPSLSLGLGGTYKQLATPTGPLNQGVSVQIGLAYDLAGARRGTEIHIEPRLNPIFPLFYSYYDKNPAGEVLVSNTESSPYEKVRVSFIAKQYMDSPRLCGDLGTIQGGESRSVPVYALFNDAIFRVTEGTKAAGEIVIEYFYLGKERRIAFPVTVQVQNRNAMTWDDSRKAAAFITAKDPLILGFAKNVSSTIRYEGSPPVSEDFRTGMALFQSLTLYGLGYAVDPKTPFATLSGNETAVDFLQFPNQTLAYRAGDCDDLSTLYAALLESVGIASALITTPGHIFVAFDIGLSAGTATRFFGASDDLIIKDDRAWLPVEVTLVKDGFLRAWRAGAQEWRKAEPKGEAGFYPVREAWKTYEPVGFVEGGLAVAIPPPERIVDGYRRELKRFLDDQVGSQVAAIKAQEKNSGKSAEQTANRLGVLYAQFGMLDQATEQFRAGSRSGKYAPALTNLGNALYLKGDMKGASDYYSRSLALAPNNTTALAGAARALNALGDFKKMSAAIERLKALSPELAARIEVGGAAGQSSRASDAGSREVDAWDE
jgi:tetratricopeptide (TPR) repeat protein